MARTVVVTAGTESVLLDDDGVALTDDDGAELFVFDPTVHAQTVTVTGD